MKTMTKLAAAFSATLLLLLAALAALAATTDLELVGGAAGLVLKPSGGKLFDLRNMNPGDSRTATITIRNDYSTWNDPGWHTGPFPGGAAELFAVGFYIAAKGNFRYNIVK